MNPLLLQLAQLDVNKPLPELRGMGRELWVLFGAIGAVTLALVAWAVLVHKRKRDRDHPYNHAPSSNRSGIRSETGETARHPRQKRRRRHRKVMNPTLAQTGGLPRPRQEGVDSEPSQTE